MLSGTEDHLVLLTKVREPGSTKYINVKHASWKMLDLAHSQLQKKLIITLVTILCQPNGYYINDTNVVFIYSKIEFFGLTVACWTTDHYHLCSNLGVAISEGCFIFDFDSLPLEVTQPV